MSASVSHPYQVSLTHNDLTTNETLLDCFHSLEHLSSSVNEIFQKIDSRVQDERNRVSSIKQRIRVCLEKVNKIRGSNQAITVFSTAKYPAPKELPPYPTLLGQTSETHPLFRDIDESARYLPAKTQESLVGNKELSHEIRTIVMRLNSHHKELERVEFIMEDEGLGPLPTHLSNVGSLLLYNSSINLYKNYQTLDNLMSTGKEKTIKEEGGKQLASAPTTIVSGDVLPDVQQLDLLFKPSMGEMTGLALPANLPLDFIANINFSGVDLPSIAPSAYGKANYSLPQITDGGYSAAPSAKQPAKATSASVGPPPPPPATTSAPPPPPPSATASVPPPPPQSSGPPPPPAATTATTSGPPPPPTAAPAAVAVPPPDDGSSLPAPDKGRLNLLDSIKNLDKGKLRKKDEAEKKAAAVQKKPEPKPLTMQDQLKARLARRNDMISGKSDRESKMRDSEVIQAARMNPPPAANKGNDKAANPFSLPMKPSGNKTKPSKLMNVGFASIEEESSRRGGDSDDDMPAGRPSLHKPAAADSDSDSEVSELSMDSKPPVTKSPVKAPVIAPPIQAPKTLPTPGGPTAGPTQRGSLLSADAPNISKMLAKAQKKNDEEDDASANSGDWDN